MQLGLLFSVFLALFSLQAQTASLVQVTNYGSNPSNTQMWIYVPDKLAPQPPIIVAIHYCSGTAQAYYQGTPYANLANQHGFIVIYPSSPYGELAGMFHRGLRLPIMEEETVTPLRIW